MKKDSKRKLKVFLVLSGFTLSMTSVLASPVVMDQYNMGGKSWTYTNWITMKGKITG